MAEESVAMSGHVLAGLKGRSRESRASLDRNMIQSASAQVDMKPAAEHSAYFFGEGMAFWQGSSLSASAPCLPGAL
eukprot:1139767-Pelagomonas_calceolata.AAC.2